MYWTLFSALLQCMGTKASSLHSSFQLALKQYKSSPHDLGTKFAKSFEATWQLCVGKMLSMEQIPPYTQVRTPCASMQSSIDKSSNWYVHEEYQEGTWGTRCKYWMWNVNHCLCGATAWFLQTPPTGITISLSI